MNSINISKNLATYAVYKEIYDSKKDSYDIISEFIKSSIHSRTKYQFSSQDIVAYLKEDFDFDIPESIIKTALKRLGAKREQGIYSIPQVNIDGGNIIVDSKQKEITDNNEHIIRNLYSL